MTKPLSFECQYCQQHRDYEYDVRHFMTTLEAEMDKRVKKVSVSQHTMRHLD